MQKMNTKTVTGQYRLYRRDAAGGVRYVRTVEYRRPADETANLADWREYLERRDAADLERRAYDAEAFEALADAACTEGVCA